MMVVVTKKVMMMMKKEKWIYERLKKERLEIKKSTKRNHEP